MVKAVFGARGQVVLGCFSLVVTMGFWVMGTVKIPHAAAWPWNWTLVGTYIFHASMFALWVASMGYIGTGLGYRATERVESVVAGEG